MPYQLVFRGYSSLNAPYGARCFLTEEHREQYREDRVLMHLMALGAF